MPSLLDLLGETWPARMAKSAWSAAKLPGDVYAGRTDPLSDEGIGRAADLGGMVMGGTFAGAPAGAMGAGAVKPIRAYHGSPHDFDRFDLSKIGTGEGAQAYGHGLYFAGNPKVAESYKLAGPEASRQMDVINGELTRLSREMDKYPRQTYNKFEDPAGDALKAKYDQLLEERARLGRMYEVNINAAPEQFLDWDKALSEMSPEVQKALSGFSPHMTGAQINESARLVPGAYRDNRVATENLRERGIPGIKYLDQGSRPLSFNPQRMADLEAAANKYRALGETGDKAAAAKAAEYEKILAGYPKPTSNYVLFRDDIIDIVKKYGLAGAAAMYGISQDEAKAAMDNPKDKKMSIGRQTYGDEE